MIVRHKNSMYTSKRKMIYGSGFVDILKGIGSYVVQNRDLVAKPMLSAVGNVGALALNEVSKAVIRKIARNANMPSNYLSNGSKEILNKLVTPAIGSGIKRF